MDHLLIAVVGGTILSACFAYLIVYGKDHLQSRQGLPRSFIQWKQAFERLVQTKKTDLHASESRPAMGARSNAESMVQDSFKKSLKQMSVIYKELDRGEEETFFNQLHDHRDVLVELCKKTAQEFKRKWGHGISDHYLKERFIELCELQAFIQNKNLKQALSVKGILELWESYAGLHLFFDDARLGSSTVSQDLEKKLKLDPIAIYRGIEFWFISRSGQSKVSLLEGYKRDQQKKPFLKSQRLLNMPKDRVMGLMLSLCFPAKHKVKIFPLLKQECEQAVLEVEQYLLQQFKRENQHQEQKKSKAKRPKSFSSQSAQAPTDYSLLNLDPTDDINKIKKAFHKQAMRYHPDRLKLETDQEQKRAHDEYVAIQKAYERLEKKYSKKAA
jgi:hypothetical protein